MTKKLVLIIILIISLLAGFFVGEISERGKWQGKLETAQKTARDEINWYKSLLEPFYPSLPEETRSTYGKITKIEDKTLWIEAQIRVSQFPLPEGKDMEKQNMKVNVTDETKIVRIETVEPTEIPLPSEEFLLEPFKEIILSFEDIKVGDNITVISAENIKGKTEISASQIQIR